MEHKTSEEKSNSVDIEDRHDSRIEFKQRLKSTRYRAIGALIIMSMFYGTAHVKLLNPMSIPNYMEKKYHKEFVFVGNYVSGDAVVSPKDEPERQIIVEVEGKMPWELKYVDHYYSDTATEYINKRLSEVAHSKYGTKVYYQGGTNFYVNDKTQKNIESKYTLKDVQNGPYSAPDAYREMGIMIHFYGPPEHKEEMIREMHEIYKALDSEFTTDGIGIELIVADDSILNKGEELKKIYKNTQVRDAFSLLHREMAIDQSSVWMIRLGDSRTSKERARIDYKYFRSIYEELYDEKTKGVQQ